MFFSNRRVNGDYGAQHHNTSGFAFAISDAKHLHSQNIPTNKKNAQNRNRTSDTRIFSPLLYQLSYLGKQDSATHVTESRIKWAEVDSNHRSKLQQIYSLSPLATRESTHITLTSQNDSI